MESAYIPAFAALAGTAIGGLTSFATSWMTQQTQARAHRLAVERDIRAALFGRFLDEAAKLYSDALQNRRDDVTGLVNIYALTNRIRLISTERVVESADTVCRIIVDTYLAPNLSLEEMRNDWFERRIDPLRDFSEACRHELQIFGRF
jgi:hypothetical protein